jgi:protein-arginine kinase activator protein McsA
MAATEVIVFEGVRYYRRPNSKNRSQRVYFFDRNSHSLHRAIYAAAHGAIPPGFDVHHDDRNPLNNAVSNLVLVPAQRHRTEHAQESARAERHLVCEQCEQPFVSPRAWARFCSGGCKSAWRRDKLRDTRWAMCQKCYRQFLAPKWLPRKFCSRLCAARARTRTADGTWAGL